MVYTCSVFATSVGRRPKPSQHWCASTMHKWFIIPVSAYAPAHAASVPRPADVPFGSGTNNLFPQPQRCNRFETLLFGSRFILHLCVQEMRQHWFPIQKNRWPTSNASVMPKILKRFLRKYNRMQDFPYYTPTHDCCSLFSPGSDCSRVLASWKEASNDLTL